MSSLADLGSSLAEPWTSPGGATQRPPRLLLTLLGDYWWQRTEPLPSAAIVALLAEFGVSDSAARAALSRLTLNGLLVTSKTGRRTFSRLSQRAAAILDDGARRIFSFGPLVALRVRQIITRCSPELADRAAHHSSELKLSAAPATAAD